MLSTLALFASSRRHGNTGAVIDRIAADLAIEVVDLSQVRMSPYDYEHHNRADEFEPLMERITGYQQIIFACPVYWYSAPPPMKVFLDRLSDYLDLPDLRPKGRRLRGKRGYVIATSGSAELSPAFVYMFKETFEYLGMRYGGALHLNCDGGYSPGKFDREIAEFVSLVRDSV
jgi:multimeric flavodoxin WrbA